MNLYKITFEDNTEIERVYASNTAEATVREWVDLEIAKGWVSGVGAYTVEDMGEYTPPVEGE